jgi:CheY-like chemotaxis protein
MKPKKILVVEDDRLTRTIICEILSRAGYNVGSAGDAPSAVRIASQEKLDLITLDIILGADSPTDSMDGLQIAAWLKRLNHDRRIPMIIFSSIDPQRYAAAIAAAPPHVFLPKPIDKHTLLTTVADVLTRPSS